ncbi:hypothetical protein TNCV_455391 [Trichonephila clavipes]|nr:hypothetical protein TNCV_455391 [Trichonephila clavipes]
MSQNLCRFHMSRTCVDSTCHRTCVDSTCPRTCADSTCPRTCADSTCPTITRADSTCPTITCADSSVPCLRATCADSVSQVPQSPVQIPLVQIPDVQNMCRFQCHKSHNHLCRFFTCIRTTCADSTCIRTCADSDVPRTCADSSVTSPTTTCADSTCIRTYANSSVTSPTVTCAESPRTYADSPRAQHYGPFGVDRCIRPAHVVCIWTPRTPAASHDWNEVAPLTKYVIGPVQYVIGPVQHVIGPVQHVIGPVSMSFDPRVKTIFGRPLFHLTCQEFHLIPRRSGVE